MKLALKVFLIFAVYLMYLNLLSETAFPFYFTFGAWGFTYAVLTALAPLVYIFGRIYDKLS